MRNYEAAIMNKIKIVIALCVTAIASLVFLIATDGAQKIEAEDNSNNNQPIQVTVSPTPVSTTAITEVSPTPTTSPASTATTTATPDSEVTAEPTPSASVETEDSNVETINNDPNAVPDTSTGKVNDTSVGAPQE